MLNLNKTHWKIINKGCGCDAYQVTPQVIIVNEVIDSLVFNAKIEKFLDIVCDRFTLVVELRCYWCGEILYHGKGRREL